MSRMNKQYLMVVGILSLLACFRLAMPQSSTVDLQKDKLMMQVPYQIGDWKGEDSDVDENTYQILETRNVLSRTYKNPKGDVIALLLVGSNRDRRVAHPPEVCYTSSHYNIISSGERTLSLSGRNIGVKEFVAQDERNPNVKENVLYLYKVGNQFTTNYYAQQIRFAMDHLTRRDCHRNFNSILCLRFHFIFKHQYLRIR